MNCVRCNTPLEANARFCRNCGLPAATSLQQNQQVWQQGAPGSSSPQNDATLAQPQSWQPTQAAQPPQQWQPTQQWQQSPPTVYSQVTNTQSDSPGTFRPVSPTQPVKPKRRRGIGGCLLTSFGILVVLIIGLGLVWSFVVRPYLHNLAIQQLDQAMTKAVNQIPPQASQLPNGPLAIQQDTLNNIITLNSSPSDPVQNINAHITSNNVQISFQISGQTSTVTGVPEAQNGKLVLTNVTIAGLAGLILSPDDITTLFNKHLADAQARVNHQVLSVQLMDQQMILVLG